MNRDSATALSVPRWLLLSGWLEIGVGLGHNVVGSLILVRPTLMAPVVATLGWPMPLLAPTVSPERSALVLALSILAGIGWTLFGSILVWQAHTRAAHPDVALLAIVLVQQLCFVLVMFLLVPFLFPIIWIVGLSAAALGMAFAMTLRSSR